MARSTNNQFYRAHQQLHRIWLKRTGIFADLTPAEQWYLHDYFKPSHELAKAELLVHRAEITARRPQLPQQAGKAYAKFIRAAAAWSSQLVASSHRRARSGGRGVQYIRVRAVVRPEIDSHAFARGIIEMVKSDLAARLAAKRQDEAGE